ncbi:hypothetical protein IT407_01260 [Candidatus Uhrbacteria bacterium]|nr:hypothetical protein [Candidatus Uhrbacteria bacterium]
MFHPDPNIRSIEERNMSWAANACSFMRELDQELLKYDRLGKFAFMHDSLDDLLALREIDLLVVCAMTAIVVRAEDALCKSSEPYKASVRFGGYGARPRLLFVDVVGMFLPLAEEPVLVGDISRRTHLTSTQSLLLLRAMACYFDREPPESWGRLVFERIENGAINAKLAPID